MSVTSDLSDLPQHAAEPKSGHTASFLVRLLTGTGAFNILGRRKTYYLVSAILVVLCGLVIALRGFNFGIEFAGGTKLQLPAVQDATVESVGSLVEAATGQADATVQIVGTGAASTIQVRTATLAPDQVVAVKDALSLRFGIPVDQVSDSAVSETWGTEISTQAVIALIVFLIAVSLFLWLRYERRVAVGALVAVAHDLIITAGIYALVGFEVTPATVIGLLAILGFSLYDTVVVYDKVQENTKGLTSLLRRNFAEAANLAINQTLMRSINTTLIALLPVGGLLVAGVAILGSGTLKDLALVQLVGMVVSGYSSVFLAVPIAVDLRLRDPVIKAHSARVAAKRKADGLIVDADGDPIGRTGHSAVDELAAALATHPGGVALGAKPQPGAKPRPGARPQPGAKPAVSGATPASGRGGASTVRVTPTGKRPTGKGQRPTGKRPQ